MTANAPSASISPESGLRNVDIGRRMMLWFWVEAQHLRAGSKHVKGTDSSPQWHSGGAEHKSEPLSSRPATLTNPCISGFVAGCYMRAFNAYLSRFTTVAEACPPSIIESSPSLQVAPNKGHGFSSREASV